METIVNWIVDGCIRWRKWDCKQFLFWKLVDWSLYLKL